MKHADSVLVCFNTQRRSPALPCSRHLTHEHLHVSKQVSPNPLTPKPRLHCNCYLAIYASEGEKDEHVTYTTSLEIIHETIAIRWQCAYDEQRGVSYVFM